MTDPSRHGEESNASDWTEVRRLVEVAMDLAPGERQGFLEEACGDDAPLRQRVERLLRSEADGLDDLEPPPAAELSALLEGEVDSMKGERIGPYELRRRLGEGGMGSVWLAVRSDGEFHRQVAIKLIRPGMDSEEILQRFRRERQVLANLDHPGIARLIDGGATAAGLPYLVMELVPGLPIDEYCDENRLSTEERLQLFRKVCAALHYAHQRLVVHRDLKPSNILVTAEGEPKLLDFGIAKMLDPEKVSSSVDLTGAMMKLMTPHYASPEQVRGRPITTASDLYSLGVILYQLLTGHLPHHLETTSAVEIERVICEEEPRRPSLAAISRAQRRTLAGDLDQIVLKTLRKEPARRYASVEQLAEDIERYRRGEPVRARPDSAIYRTQKFVRRHRFGVAAGLAVLLSLVAGFITSTVQFGIATEARAAERELREGAESQAAELALLAKELEEETRFAQEQERLARARLAEVETLSVDLRAQKELAEKRFAEVRTFATGLVFDVLGELAPLEGALKAKELVSRLGLEHLDRLAADHAADPGLRRQVAMGYVRMAELQGSASGPNFGRYDDALEIFSRGIAIAEELVDENPDDPGSAFVLAQALFLRGDVLARIGRQLEAEDAYGYALEVCQVIEEHPSPAPGHRYVLSCVLDRLGECASHRGELEEARAILEELVGELDDLCRREPEDARHPGDLLACLVTFADVLREAKAADEALVLARRALELAEELWREEGSESAHLDLGNALCALGGIERECGELPAAIEVLERARTLFEEPLAADPEHQAALTGLLVCHGQLARIHQEQAESAGRHRAPLESAGRHLRREIEIAESLRRIGAFRPEWEEDLAASARMLEAIEVELAGE